MNLRNTLEERIAAALSAAGAPGAAAMVKPASRPEFGDYQADGCLAAAKSLQTHPRRLAEAAAEKLDLSDLAEKVEVAGAGFLNIFLRRDWLQERLSALAADPERLGVSRSPTPRTVVVDYSGPNLAKEMHVGHLRSTIIGDALVRVLRFLGWRVIPQNHVGDWGTQFGMLIAQWEEESRSRPAEKTPVSDMEDFYRAAKKKFDEDPTFAARCREYVVKLQRGDERTVSLWKQVVTQSLEHAQSIYDSLGILLTREDIRGESFYNEDLPQVVARLEEKGLLQISEGAAGVSLEEFQNQQGQPFFLIVRKSDGGYLYATTDLAALWFRCGKGKQDGRIDWAADRILYVTDSRQAQHFAQVFTVARQAGFVPPTVSLEHVPFGMMLGTDGRPFKTREGGTVKLRDLIRQAEQRAADLVRRKNPELPEAEVQTIAHRVGIGALKYADLSQNRASDYVFSWDKMLSLEGNTAPYLQYAYARIRSIFRKQGTDNGEPEAGSGQERAIGEIRLDEPAERTLGVKLLQFPETVEAVAETCLPNLLCSYLYDLAGGFMGFYESCPVLKAQDPLRQSRLTLCRLAAQVLQTGLRLLGIETLEQM